MSEEYTTLESLRVTPGNTATYNPSIHGAFVVLVVNSNTPEPIGIVVPYSYVKDSSAALSSKTVSLNNIGNYLSKAIVPEVWSNQTNILQDQIYLAISILAEEQATLLIQDLENDFYLPYNTAQAVVAWDALGKISPNPEYQRTNTSNPSSAKILNPLSISLLADRVLWNRSITETVSPVFNNFIAYAFRKIKNPYFLHPKLVIPDDRNVTNINECYSITQDHEFAISAISSPTYCTLVHDPIYHKFTEFALPCLCNEEVLNTLNDSLELDASYLFNLYDLEIDTLYSHPLNSLQQSLVLLDYFAGFPVSEISLKGVLVTGNAIPACIHGSMYKKNRPQTSTTQEDVLSDVKKIDFLYPEYSAYWEGRSDIETAKAVQILQSEDVRFKVFGTTKGQLIGTDSSGHYDAIEIIINNETKTKLKFLVEELRNLEAKAVEIFRVVQRYRPGAVMHKVNMHFLITKVHRIIKIAQGDKHRIIKSVFPMTRGWITDDNGVRNCMLSATCLYSAFTFTIYNYYRKGLANAEKERKLYYHNRGYSDASELYKFSDDKIKQAIEGEKDAERSTYIFDAHHLKRKINKSSHVNIFYVNERNNLFTNALQDARTRYIQI